MILWPAVDIRAGKAVRLERGRFETETVYDQDPLEAAKRWAAEGARALHVVDLDGARAGSPVNLKHVERIATATDLPVQMGGGLRTAAAVEQAIAAGAQRVILGTVAYADPELVTRLVAEYGEQVAVSLDARQGRLAGAGWLEQTDLTPEQLAAQLAQGGVRNLIYSNIDHDGMLAGPDLEGIARIAAATDAHLIYSGGIASLQDLEALTETDHDTLEGVIVGKALYERRFTVAEGQEALDR
jgi:phosphoribosylformimino-5-aminoimidazole carboxamide ribotide isomerase